MNAIRTPDRTLPFDAVDRLLAPVRTGADLRESLFGLVDTLVEILKVDHAAAFVMEQETIHPRAAAAARPTVELFRRFRTLGPLSLAEVIELAERLDREDTALLYDDSVPALLPNDWVEAFSLRSVAITSLGIDRDSTCLLAIGHKTPRRFTKRDLAILRAGAGVARLVMGAEAHSRALSRASEVQGRLLVGLASLASGTHLDEVLERISACVSSLFDGSSCRIELVREDGAATTLTGPVWGRTVFPLRTDGQLHGYLLVEGGHSLGPSELELVDAFSQQAAIAIQRAQLVSSLEDELQRARALHRLAELTTGSGRLQGVLRKLNADVGAISGVELVDVVFGRSRVSDLMGTRPPTRSERALMARLGEQDVRTLDNGPDAGRVASAIPIAGRVAGLLFASTTETRTEPSQAQRALVETIASGIGQMAYRVRLNDTVQRAESRLAVAEARRALTGSISRTVGKTLDIMWREISAAMSRDGEGGEVLQELVSLRNLVARAILETHTAAQALSSLRVRDEGLITAMRSLVGSFQDLTEVSTTLKVTGNPRRLPPQTEEALYAAAFEALTAVEEASRASSVLITVAFEDAVTLTIRDDGVNLAQRTDAGPGPGAHFGLRAIKEIAKRVGGTVTMESVEPRGLLLQLAMLPGPSQLEEPVTQPPARLLHLRSEA